MVILPIKRKWFDMIMSGEKLEEYRDIKSYWKKRLNAFELLLDMDKRIEYGDLGYMTHVIRECKIRAGYNKTSPTATISYWLDVGVGKPEWGAEPNVDYYRLHIVNKELE